MKFEVEVPEDYDENDRSIFRDSIEEALKAIERDARMDVESARALRQCEGVWSA